MATFSKTLVFSETDTRLIDLVKLNPCLYRKNDKNKSSKRTRDDCWQIIAKKLSLTAEQCKKRWKGMRDSYCKKKRLGILHRNIQMGHLISLSMKLHIKDQTDKRKRKPIHHQIKTNKRKAIKLKLKNILPTRI